MGSIMGSRVEFEKMLQFVDEHKIRPVASKVYEGLEKFSEVFKAMLDRVQFGKLVVTVNGYKE